MEQAWDITMELYIGIVVVCATLVLAFIGGMCALTVWSLWRR